MRPVSPRTASRPCPFACPTGGSSPPGPTSANTGLSAAAWTAPRRSRQAAGLGWTALAAAALFVAVAVYEQALRSTTRLQQARSSSRTAELASSTGQILDQTTGGARSTPGHGSAECPDPPRDTRRPDYAL